MTTHTLTTDRDQNTRILMEVPGLSETITPQLGNCIFGLAAWAFAGDTAPVLSTAANAVDVLSYYAINATTVVIGMAEEAVS